MNFQFYFSNLAPTHAKSVVNAMKNIEHSICVRFINQTDQTDYVSITGDKKAHQSDVGRRGEQQEMEHEQPNREGKIVHEMELYNFYKSPIHDNYIRTNWENIKPSKIKKLNNNSKLIDFNMEFFLDSIVHLNDTKNVISKLNTTIETHNPTLNDKGGHRKNLSEDDFLKINRIYECELSSYRNKTEFI